MNRWLIFVLGMAARAFSVLAGLYADWLFAKITEAAMAGIDFLEDLKDFGRWLMEVATEYFTGRQADGYALHSAGYSGY